MSENVIELNGKRYDAVTGVYLGKSHADIIPAAPPVTPHSTKVIDGFIRPAHRQVHAAPAPPKPTPTVHSAAAEKSKAHHKHTTAAHLKAHKPERTKTLMRATVHKPTARKPVIKTQAPAEIMPKPASSIARKHSVAQVDPSRLERAQLAPKHAAVKHFHPSPHGLQRGETYHTTSHHATVPVIAVKEAPKPEPHHEPHSDIFEAAMHRANSHQEPKVKRRRHHRLANTFAAVVAFLVLGGFIAYLNMPNIELHIASAQAGFRATMPAYTPTGYAMSGHINRAGNTVSLKFISGESSYVITQQASNWDSQALLDNTLALSGPHQTVQKNGQTIYLYDNGAAWVNNGVRYDLSSNATLSSSDIVSIATSL